MQGKTLQEAVGRAIPRLDGESKVTGQARYLDDLTLPGMLYGRTVRTEVPYGVLRGIERDPSFDWSDVVVVTAADIPGTNTIALIEEDQPALVPIGGRVMHCDEAVALVAAKTPDRALAAMRAIKLDIEVREPVLTMEDALAKKQVLYGADNVFKKFEIKRGEQVEAALGRCDLVIEGTYRTGAQEQMYIEPQGAMAHFEPDGTCVVVGSIQCPYYVLKALLKLLATTGEHVVVKQSVTGGGFGGKEEYPSMIAAHAVLLAKKAGAPVKIVYDRVEDVRATTKRHPSIVKHRLGVMKDGTFVAADVDVLFDGGAYLTLSPVVLSRGVLHAAGPYRIPNVRVRGRAVATNHPPHGAFRGFGAPQTTFAYERQVQKAARELGIDPFALRRKNMLRIGDATATGQVLKESVGSAAVLDAVEHALTSGDAPIGSARPRGRGLRRGRGLAFYHHGAGFTGSGEERLKGQATVCVAKDGGLEVRSASTDIGQGTITIFTQLAADALGVPMEAVRVAQPSTDRVPDSGPTVASRTCMVVGSIVAKASTQLREHLERWGKEKGVSGDIVALAKAHAERDGEKAFTVTYAPPPGIVWDDNTYSGDAYPVYGWAACLVELAVDEDTYEVTVERCLHAVDIGKAIHPVLVKGQIEGGTLQALGWALWERIAYKNGRVANPTMTDCIIPTSIEAPEMETLLVEVPYSHGPHGAKGVGEIPMDGPAAAVAAALEDALSVAFDVIPMVPEEIEKTMTEASRA